MTTSQLFFFFFFFFLFFSPGKKCGLVVLAAVCDTNADEN